MSRRFSLRRLRRSLLWEVIVNTIDKGLAAWRSRIEGQLDWYAGSVESLQKKLDEEQARLTAAREELADFTARFPAVVASEF